MRKIALIIVLLAWEITVPAAECPAVLGAEDSPGKGVFLVSTSWLAEHLNDRSLVLIHAGPKEEYEAGHIQGAQFLSLQDISTPMGQGLTLELPLADKLKTTLEKIGICNTSRIIVCFGKDWVTPATRVYFTLDFVGLGAQTSILDGGLPAWQREGHPVTNEPSRALQGTFAPHPRQDLVVDAAWVQANLHNPAVAIVDARTPEFYSGAKAGIGKRVGHIPGAVNIPFTSLVDDTNRLKEPNVLKEMFKAANIKPGSHIVSYCHIGQQASLVYFVAKYLGYDAGLYDGSFEDWSARSELPVATAR